jgi:hypothetical protein
MIDVLSWLFAIGLFVIWASGAIIFVSIMWKAIRRGNLDIEDIFHLLFICGLILVWSVLPIIGILATWSVDQ